VYVISAASRFDVKTGKAGLFGFLGHDHVIHARAFSGRVVYYPSTPASSHVAITVPVDSLEVLTPPDTEEIRKVTAAMRTEVLEVDRFPEMTFASLSVVPIDSAFQIELEITMHGAARVVLVDVSVEVGPDTVRAAGRFSVKQTDFGIRPFRGGPGGSVKVADRVTFDFEAVAVRAP
jgi:polyisoprenoid-binding protein YceI